LIAQELGSGDADMSKRLHVASKDEIGKAAMSFNVFIDKVQNNAKQRKIRAQEAMNAKSESEAQMEKNEMSLTLARQMIQGSIHNAGSLRNSLGE
jgi:methyl-accepting chemotaxis protein